MELLWPFETYGSPYSRPHHKCDICNIHYAVRRRKDGNFAIGPHGSGRHEKCPGAELSKTTLSKENLSKNGLPPVFLKSYREGILRWAKDMVEKRSYSVATLTPRGELAAVVYDSKHNGAPGLDSPELLFVLFKDVLRFLVSAELWEAIEQKETYEWRERSRVLTELFGHTEERRLVAEALDARDEKKKQARMFSIRRQLVAAIDAIECDLRDREDEES